MQSLLQYRSIGRHVEAQVQQSQRKFQARPDLTLAFEQSPAEATPNGTKNLPHLPNARIDCTSDAEKLKRNDAKPTARPAQHITNGATQAWEDLVGSLPGVCIQDGSAFKGFSDPIFVVNWQGEDDPLNPRNWSIARRVVVTIQVSLISAAVVIASSIDATALPQAADEFGVSHVVESMATGMSSRDPVYY